jgi:hypothetical protein
LDLWPPEVCAEARRLLTEAETAASGEEEAVRQRVRLYRDGFRQTELWSAVYHGEKSLRSLADLERCGDAQACLERLNREVVLPNPLHRAAIRFEERAASVPGGALAGALLRLSDEPNAQGTLQRLASASASAEVRAAAGAALALRAHPERAVQRLANPGFEPQSEKPPATPDHRSAPPGCGVWFRPGTPGQGEAAPEAARSGKFGYVLRGAEASCVLQSAPVQPGERYLASVYLRGKLSARAEAKLLVQWQDATGKWLTEAGQRADRLPAGGTADWLRLCVLVEVPPKAARLVFCVSAYDQGPQEALHADDARLLRMPR